jgi:hypothetical protein
MGVDINEPRRNHFAPGFDLFTPCFSDLTDFDDSTSVNCDVGANRLAAISVDDLPVPNNQINCAFHDAIL